VAITERRGMTKMLEGIRILDLSNFFSGPLCGYLLAQMGAEVIKVEEPSAGDPARRLGLAPELSKNLMGAAYLAANGGKKSVTINLKSDQGKAILKKLLATSSVLIENFRPGVMDRLGLGYDVLRQIRPDLIYCAISGFGQAGPLRASPAFDQIIQGMSGLMSITGSPELSPLRVGFPVSDSIAGIMGALAINGAIIRRTRDGCGEMLDVSMLDSLLSSMGWAVSNYLIAGVSPEPMGNDNFTSSPSGTFRANDGTLNIASNTQEQYERLIEALDDPDIASDHRFQDRESRKVHRSEMNAAIERGLQKRGVDEWVELLSASGVPAGKVLSVPQAFEQPQIKHRELLQTFEHVVGTDGDLTIMRPGFRGSEGPFGVETPPPTLGADTAQVLQELGYSSAELDALKEARVI
jgi:CoA:oxalate CoA-transferase